MGDSPNAGAENEAPKESYFPAVYLLTGYFGKGRPISKLEPLINTLVFADDPTQVTDNKQKPVILRTDKNGKLNVVKGDGNLASRQLFHAHKDRHIIIPPPGAVGFLAAAKGGTWTKEMINMAATFAPTEAAEASKLVNVPYANIRKPLTDSSGGSAEEEYKAWYAQLPKGKPLQAYIVAKTRAIVFVVNSNLPVEEGGLVKVLGPNNKHFQFNWRDVEGNHRLGVISGNKQSLPQGIYRLDIQLQSGAIRDAPSKWNSFVNKSRDEGKKLYRIAEMANFDITNPAGEFEIMNCNPVSLEEALITQYPRFYSHLIEAAKSRDGQSTKISGNAKTPAQGFLDYCTNWRVIKEKSQLAAGLMATDIEVYEEGGKKHNGKNALAWAVGKALHTHLATTEDKKVKSVLDAVFSTKNGADAWATFHAARKDYLEAISSEKGLEDWKTALKKHYYKIPPYSAEDLEKYSKTLSGKIGIPKQAFDLLGRAINVVDMFENVTALSKSGYTHFTKSIPNYEKSKRDYSTVAGSYFYWLSDKQFDESIELRSVFALNQSQIKAEAKQDIIEKAHDIIASLECDSDRKVSVAGHTCDLGGYEYNLSLSRARAKSVMNVLIEAGVDAARIDAEGYGYEQPQVENNSNENRAINRRVVISAYIPGHSDVFPSREGMGSLERYRNLTVQGYIGLTDEALAMACQATNLALGILSVIPVTAPAAAAVALLVAGTQALISVGAMLDEALMDSVLSHYVHQFKKVRAMTRESGANQSLIIDLHRGIKNKENMPNDVQWAIQFRVRAEAIAGLVSLLMRAAMDSSDEPFEQRVRKYHIDAYIENFLLNDTWLYPLNNLRILRMDTYWLFAINDFARNYDEQGYDPKKINYGLDSNNRLTTADMRKELKSEAIKRLKNAQPQGGTQGGYMMAPAPPQFKIEDHLTTNYQGYFPIHRIGTEDILAFAETFKPVHSDYTKGNYLYTEIYFKEKGKWISFSDPSHRETMKVSRNRTKSVPKVINPFTNIRVLVVFDEKMSAIAPLSFDVVRTDGVNLNGPKYKEIAKELRDDELLPNEKQYAGKIGCVFYPFFQLWDKTYLGLKPMAGSLAMSIFSTDFYYREGNLSNMRYVIRCQVGDNERTKIDIPLKSKPSPAGGIQLAKEISHYIEDEMRVRVDTHDGIQSALINSDFLKSETKEFSYPTLYKGEKRVTVAVKIGEDSPYIASGMNTQAAPHFKDEIQETEDLNCGLSINGLVPDQGSMKINGFDWDTPIEFAFIAMCTELNKDDYIKQKVEWRKIPCSVQMFEDATLWDSYKGDTKGPKLTKKLCYLGRVTFSGGQPKFDSKDAIENGGGDADLAPISKMLAALNRTDLNRSQRAKILSLAGLDHVKSSGSRYIFAAHFKSSYVSPKMIKINSIRPFGKWVYNENSKDKDSYFEYMFKNFKTAGDSGFQLEDIRNNDNEDYRFDFSVPKSHQVGAPWTRMPPAKELAEWERKLTPKEYLKLITPVMLEKDWMQWIEENADELEPNLVDAFKRK